MRSVKGCSEKSRVLGTAGKDRWLRLLFGMSEKAFQQGAPCERRHEAGAMPRGGTTWAEGDGQARWAALRVCYGFSRRSG